MAPRKTTKPKSPIKAFGRSLSDFPKLSKAELKLIEACRIGQIAEYGDGTRPEAPTLENTIRPELIRFLALGGDENAPMHERALWIREAWIEGDIEFEGCQSGTTIILECCFVDGEINITDAHLKGLNFSGTRVEKIRGDGCKIYDDIVLNDKFLSEKGLRLVGARIEGDLNCRGGSFNFEKRKAPVRNDTVIIADRAKISGNVFLDIGFEAAGEVRLLGCQVEGDFTCREGKFNAKNGNALSLDGTRINGALSLEGEFSKRRPVRLISVHANKIIDNLSKLPQNSVLDGFTYGQIIGGSATDAATRIAWLNKQPADHLGINFKPQPWEQLIKVLREMGHTADADEVAIEKQNALFRAGKIQGFDCIWHLLYKYLAGYGYRPSFTITWMVFIWFISAMHFQLASASGLMGPTSAIIQTTTKITDICNVPTIATRQSIARETQWTRCAELPQAYTTFNPYLYSLDLILPLVNLQQDTEWSPIVTEPDSVTPIWLGVWFRTVMWFEILFGWMASLLLVAVLGNLVKKD